MERIWIKDMEVGKKIGGVYAVSSAQLREYSGGQFISMRLADRSGKISAICWDGNEEKFKTIPEGCLVQIEGKVGRYQGSTQLTISKLEPLSPDVEFNPEDFLPSSPVDLDRTLECLIAVGKTLNAPYYRLLWQMFFEDQEAQEKFRKVPAGKRWHHACIGGLLEHTASMVSLSEKIVEHYPDLNRDLLLTGALFHDIGKIRELDYRSTFEYTDEGRLIGHILMGARLVSDYIAQIGDFPKKEALLVEHLILSHQGETEESPRIPRCREAMVLHLVDMIDSQLSAYTREMNNTGQLKGEWTPYIRLINRQLYCPQEEQKTSGTENGD